MALLLHLELRISSDLLSLDLLSFRIVADHVDVRADRLVSLRVGMRLWRTPIAAKDVQLLRRIGEGNFGHVYLGAVPRTDGKNLEVVLKRVKPSVEDAHLVADAEAKLNQCCAKNAPGCCPTFLGAFEVQGKSVDVQLSPGHWLVWEFEGIRTLADYWKQKTGTDELAMEMFGCSAEEAGGNEVVVAEVMRQLLGCLVKMHGAGLVHRDVKPANMVFSTKEKKFKLIDLGAMADLRTGTNYVPTESFLDPSYCPPEQYVMPVDSPHLQKRGALASMAMSPVLWAKNQPDKFDAYSAGIILLQLAVPCLRKDRNLKSFNANLAHCEYDLYRWRAAYGSRLAKKELVLLDSDDAALLDLAASLLREKVDRASCGTVLRSPFFERYKVPNLQSTDARGATKENAKARKRAEDLLAEKIAAATEKKQNLDALHSQGASPVKLKQEEEELRAMQGGVKDVLTKYKGLVDRVAKLLKVGQVKQQSAEEDELDRSLPLVHQLDMSKYVEHTKSAVRVGGALTGLAGKVAGDLAGALGKEVLAFVEAEAGTGSTRRMRKAQGRAVHGNAQVQIQDEAERTSIPSTSSEGDMEEDMITTEGWGQKQDAAGRVEVVGARTKGRRDLEEDEELDACDRGTVKRHAGDTVDPVSDLSKDSVERGDISFAENAGRFEGLDEPAQAQRQEMMDNVQALREQVLAMEAALAEMASTMEDIQSSGMAGARQDVDGDSSTESPDS